MFKFLKSISVFFIVIIMDISSLSAVDGQFLKENLVHVLNPFKYPLNISVFPSQDKKAEVILCLHGYGGNYQTGAILSQFLPDYNVVSFDFPDANIYDSNKRLQDHSYGSINEVLPAIYLAKICLNIAQVNSLSLYGFSAGGAAVVNMLAVLNTQNFNSELAAIGITKEDKLNILKAIQKGYVILDCPLKSIEEIIDLRGSNPELSWMAKKYAQNGFRPIDALKNLTGLSLNIIVNFQDPDEAVLNRDDKSFAERLQNANANGRTLIVTSHDQGHTAYHPALWAAFKSFKQKSSN